MTGVLRAAAAVAACFAGAAAVLSLSGCGGRGDTGAGAPPRDYAGEWMDLARERQGIAQESQDGRGMLDEIIAIHREVLARSTPYPPPSFGGVSKHFQFAHALADDATDAAREEAGRVLGELDRAGLFLRLAELGRYPGATCAPPTGDLGDSSYGGALAARDIADALSLRIRIAGEAGRWADAREAAEGALHLAAVYMRRPRNLDYLAGAAMVAGVFEELVRVAPGRIDDAGACRGLLAAIEGLPAGDLAPQMKGERLIAMEAATQRAPERGGRAQASRAQEKEQIAAIFDRYDAIIQQPPGVWDAEVAAAGAQIDAVPRRFVVTHQRTPAIGGVLATRDLYVTWRQGLRAILAIELHRIERGALPSKVEDLVPGILADAPLDPFARPPAPLRFVPVAGGDEAASGYMLYSVGFDGMDNGGAPHPHGNHVAVTKRGAHADVVILPAH